MIINLLDIFITSIILVLVIIVFVKKRSKETFTEGHSSFTLKTLAEKPKIIEIQNFLSPEECDHLIQLAENRQCFQRSEVQADTAMEHDMRTSWSCVLDRGEDEVVKRIENRAASFTSRPYTHVEPLQVVRYQPGQFFKGHYDFFPPGFPGTETATLRGGQRHYTFFVYLNDVQGGGYTHFPKVPLRVSPTKGKAAFWSNLQPDGTVDYSTYHAGEPPHSEVKYGLNIWIRQQPFV